MCYKWCKLQVDLSMKVKPKFGFLAGSNSEAIQHAYNAETDCV